MGFRLVYELSILNKIFFFHFFMVRVPPYAKNGLKFFFIKICQFIKFHSKNYYKSFSAHCVNTILPLSNSNYHKNESTRSKRKITPYEFLMLYYWWCQSADHGTRLREDFEYSFNAFNYIRTIWGRFYWLFGL